MKSGDLVRLVSFTNQDSVLLGHFEPVLHVDKVPVGTIAVFMDSMSARDMEGDRSQIFVNGSIRWVYCNEHEPL